MEISLSIQAVQDFLQKTSNIDEPVTIKQFGLSRKPSENSEKEQTRNSNSKKPSPKMIALLSMDFSPSKARQNANHNVKKSKQTNAIKMEINIPHKTASLLKKLMISIAKKST